LELPKVCKPKTNSNTFMYALNVPSPPPTLAVAATKADLMPQQLLLWALLLIFKVAKSQPD
jgi:hypothetical protein